MAKVAIEKEGPVTVVSIDRFAEARNAVDPETAGHVLSRMEHGAAAAVINAICDAIGIRLSELPASPDRVLEAILTRKRKERLRVNAKALVHGATVGG